eukprot:m51a1_g1442 hypothetical protein (385) ;mRNA; r:124473-125860
MVLVLRTVAAVGQLAPARVPAGYPRDSTLDLFAQHAMVGLLRQMTSLSDSATSVFAEVVDEARRVSERLGGLGQRVSMLREGLPEVQRAIERARIEDMCRTARSDRYVEAEVACQLFTPQTLPASIRELRDAAMAPPDMAPLDALAEAPRGASKRYSDPEFFAAAWISDMRLRRQLRKKRRVDAGPGVATGSPAPPECRAPVRKVAVRRWNPMTGELLQPGEADEGARESHERPPAPLGNDGRESYERPQTPRSNDGRESRDAGPPETPVRALGDECPPEPPTETSTVASKAGPNEGTPGQRLPQRVETRDARSELMLDIIRGARLRPASEQEARGRRNRPRNPIEQVLWERIRVHVADSDDEASGGSSGNGSGSDPDSGWLDN